MGEEDHLIAQDIIEMVPDDVPTTWCTNPVIAPKPHDPESIRYCSNMRAPNTAIKRPITEALTVEDIKVRLAGSKVFSILDMKEAYHQLKLCEESRHLTTYYGTRGRMRYKRLNYGGQSAQDIFDKAMDDTIHGLDVVLHIRDDFIIHGSSQEEHDARLRAFMARMVENGLTFSFKKCKIGLPKIEFFGIQFHADGTSPFPKRIESLQHLPHPQSAEEVSSLLSMAQYSAQYIPNFSTMIAPLRDLTRPDIPWSWEKRHEEAFSVRWLSAGVLWGRTRYATGRWCRTQGNWVSTPEAQARRMATGGMP